MLCKYLYNLTCTFYRPQKKAQKMKILINSCLFLGTGQKSTGVTLALSDTLARNDILA